MITTPPAGRTLFGVTAWPVPDGSRRALTWDGPGARVALRRPARDIDGLAYLGADVGAVSGPCPTAAAAQAAVDAWIAAEGRRER